MVETVAVARVEEVTAVGVKLNSGSVTGGLIPEYKHNTHHMKKKCIEIYNTEALGSKAIFLCTEIDLNDDKF